jgi:membrane protein YdbS with pleckstrin-like domain
LKYRFFFEYIYFSVAKTYYKWDGKTGATGIVAVMLIQVVMICDLIFVVRKFFPNESLLSPYASYVGILVLVLFAAFGFMNFGIYSQRYIDLKKHWQGEAKNLKLTKGFLVFLSIVFPWVLMLILGLM